MTTDIIIILDPYLAEVTRVRNAAAHARVRAERCAQRTRIAAAVAEVLEDAAHGRERAGMLRPAVQRLRYARVNDGNVTLRTIELRQRVTLAVHALLDDPYERCEAKAAVLCAIGVE